MKLQKTLIALTTAGMLTGCANMSQMTHNQKMALGGLVGAVSGGVLGHQVNDKNGRYVGAVLGGLAGAGLVHMMDKQQQALNNSLQNTPIDVSRVDQSTIKVNLPSEVTFAVNSDRLNGGVQSSLSSIVGILNQYPQTVIHVLGFTDSDGSDQYNLALSQRRAQSVANFLASRGVAGNRIVVKGYGEQFPVASNASAAGKAQNRRAEIYIKAVEKGNEQAAYTPIY